MLLWAISSVASVVGVVGTAALFAQQRRNLGWKRTVRDAMLLVLATLLIALLAPCASGSANPFEVLFAAAYNLMQAASIQLDTGGIAEATREQLNPLWATGYITLVTVMAIVTPALVVSTALFELRKWFLRFTVRHQSKHRKTVYVFSGLGENEVTLAQSILDHGNASGSPAAGILGPRSEVDDPPRPLVVFCGVSEDVREEMASVISGLEDDYRDDVVFTPNSTGAYLRETSRFESVHHLFFSGDHTANVVGATALYRAIAALAAEEGHALGDGAADGEAVDVARAYAGKFHLYCLHSDENDELTFDTIGHRDGADELVKAAMDSLEVRLLSETENRVYSLFSRHPLFRAFDKVPLYQRVPKSTDGSVPEHMERIARKPSATVHDGPRELLVIVCGLGSMGIEALKAAYWFGRLPGVSLHVLGIDREGDKIRESLTTSCPLMMAESNAHDGTPVVRIVEADVNSPSFESLLIPNKPDTAIYAIVTLGNDQLNLDTALAMRRLWERARLERTMGEEYRPIIAPLIYSHEIYDAASVMVTERQEHYGLSPFGLEDEVFSFEQIIESPWERRAIAMAGAYDECWAASGRGTTATMPFDATLAGYNQYEIKKLSNRTSTRHIPYRLWSVGLEPHEFVSGVDYGPDGTSAEPRELTQELWFEALGIKVGAEGLASVAAEVDALFGDAFDGSSSPEEAAAAINDLRQRYPRLCELADIEHERWAAFYASHGWRDLSIQECERLKRLGVIEKPREHQSALMRMHCYLCDLEKLTERGIALGEDPYRYDRAAIIEVPRILSGSIFG